jgi:hypothetical protein
MIQSVFSYHNGVVVQINNGYNFGKSQMCKLKGKEERI